MFNAKRRRAHDRAETAAGAARPGDDPDPARPVLLAGPTASGKSARALQIAERQDRVIVNADAMQVYGCWQVLTARPTAAQTARVPHLLYGHRPCTAPYSAGAWLREVAAVLERHPTALIVGGTGLYLSALTGGLADIPDIPAAIRAEAEARLAAEGCAALAAQLDAASRARIDTANPARVLRAWEVERATGHGIAAWHAATPAPLLPPGAATALVIEADPDRLAARIDRRFEAMMRDGALAEVRAARAWWDPALPAARAIGAAELMAYLDGTTPRAAAVAAAKRATRRYAKRQRSWFRNRFGHWQRLGPD